MSQPILTRVEHKGQKYYDTPVYLQPVKMQTALSDALAEIHGHVTYMPKSIDVAGERRVVAQRVRTDVPSDILIGYQRTWLNWV